MSRGSYSARRLADRKLNTGDAMPCLASASFSDGSRLRRLKDRGWVMQSPRGRKSERCAQLLLLVLSVAGECYVHCMVRLLPVHRHAGERLLGETNRAIGHLEDHRWNRQCSVPERVVNGKSAESRKTSEHPTVNHVSYPVSSPPYICPGGSTRGRCRDETIGGIVWEESGRYDRPPSAP